MMAGHRYAVALSSCDVQLLWSQVIDQIELFSVACWRLCRDGLVTVQGTSMRTSPGPISLPSELNWRYSALRKPMPDPPFQEGSGKPDINRHAVEIRWIVRLSCDRGNRCGCPTR